MNQEKIIKAGFYALLDNTDAMIFMKDVAGVYRACSLPFAQMTGHTSVEEIIGKTDFDIFEDPELAKRYTDDDRALFEADEHLLNYVEPLTDEHGHPRYSNTSKYILRNAQGEKLGILGLSRDITKDYLARQRYQQELKYLFELPEDTYAALYMDIDEWRIIQHKRHKNGEHAIALQETMEGFINNALDSIPEKEVPEVREFYASLSKNTMMELIENGKRNHWMEYPRIMADGQTIWVHVAIHFLIDPETGHRCAIWTLQNIHSKKREDMEKQYAAEHDALTGLWNRAYMTRQIEKTLQDYPDALHALFVIDVDNFKQLNDTKGHQVGDKFLHDLAVVLKNSFRESDIVGRFGGDEFFVFMRNVSGELPVTEKAETILSLCKMAAQRYMDVLSISIGVGMYPHNGMTMEDLYKQADHALYEAKKQKNAFKFADKVRLYTS